MIKNYKKVLGVVSVIFITMFMGCQEAIDLAEGKTESDIQIDSVYYSVESGKELRSGTSVLFKIDVTNYGGTDSAGVNVQMSVDSTPLDFVATGMLNSEVNQDGSDKKTLLIDWKSIAGKHTFTFYIKGNSDDNTKEITLDVDIAEIVFVEEVVEVAVVEEELKSIAGSDDKSPNEVIENIAEILADTTTKSDNEVAVLKTFAIISEEKLLISEEAPTKIVAEDKSTEVLFIPLAIKNEDNSIVVEEGSFLITITSEVEEVAKSEVTDTGIVVTKTTTKEVAVPLIVKKDETAGTTTIKNVLGGIVINADGSVNLLDLQTRAIADRFWPIIQIEISDAAITFVTESSVATDDSGKMAALIKFIGKLTSIISSYELQSAVINEKPVISIEVGKVVYDVRDGDDLIRVTWDTFIATVSDDKEGATFISDSSLIPTENYLLHATSLIITAQDSDGETASVTVTSKFVEQRVKDFYVHDQGALK